MDDYCSSPIIATSENSDGPAKTEMRSHNLGNIIPPSTVAPLLPQAVIPALNAAIDWHVHMQIPISDVKPTSIVLTWATNAITSQVPVPHGAASGHELKAQSYYTGRCKASFLLTLARITSAFIFDACRRLLLIRYLLKSQARHDNEMVGFLTKVLTWSLTWQQLMLSFQECSDIENCCGNRKAFYIFTIYCQKACHICRISCYFSSFV